jgi:hemolysin activation/secretion protein
MQTISSSDAMFSLSRFGATGSFIYFRGDISHTHELPGGFQAYGKIQGQASGQPLISNEQISEGGLGTVRGYLESEALGDNGIIGTAELRTPSLGGLIGKSVGKDIDEWRLYVFGDWGLVGINEPLVEQVSTTQLASVGGGMRVRTFGHVNGSVDLGLPLDQGPDTGAYSPHLTFRLWADF